MTGNCATKRVKGLGQLCVSSSLLALGLAIATPAVAQDSGDDSAPPPTSAADDQSIVVTGTRIQGVAPVGSAVIPVGRDEIKKMGVSTTTDALRKLPEVVNFGGSDDQSGGSEIQNTSLNSIFAESVNLRGLGTASTLSLVDGHRVAPQGPNGLLFDFDNIPPVALERVEVVADGGSAIYGSDAIAGVVNYILRKPQNTLEAAFRAGFANSVREYIGSVALGRTWGSGGIFLAYQYQHRTALEAADRPDLYNSDLSPYGGGANPLFSNPSNVQFVANGPANNKPKGQDGTALPLGDLSTTPN